MAYNISTIKSSIEAGGGVARNNKYLVFIRDKTGNQSVRRFSALIDRAEFPGKSFMTTKRQTYGPPRKIPYLTQYDDFNMTILCTANMEERVYFDDWQNRIANVNSGYFSYYDDYVSTIAIAQLNEQGIATFSIELEEAYPITIQQQQLSYSGDGGMLSLNVIIAYHKWRNTYQFYDDTGSGSGGRPINSDAESPTLEEIGGKTDSGIWKPTWTNTEAKATGETNTVSIAAGSPGKKSEGGAW